MKVFQSKLSVLASIFFLLFSLTVEAQQAIHLGNGINTEFEEREPVLSPDGRTLFFWRRKDPNSVAGFNDPGDVWFSRKGFNGRWRTARPIGPPLNGRGHEFVWKVSPAQDTLWVVHTGPGVSEAGVGYVVKNNDGNWSRTYPVHIKNYRFSGDYKDFYFGKNRIMVLVNQDDKSYGGSDIYVAFPKNDTSWRRPINLGPVINTGNDEDSPFLSADGKYLYFNSNGHGGNGDHDIWVSKRIDNSWTNWTQPKNLGAPINQAGYDFDFTISDDGKWGFWGSDREGGRGINDLYAIDFTSCAVDLYPEGDLTVCEGRDMILEAGFTTGKSISYQWLKDGQLISQADKRQLTIESPGTYQVIRTKDGCRDTSNARTVRFVPPPIANIDAPADLLCVDDSVSLRARSLTATSFQWQYNGLDIPYSNRSIFWAKRPGNYSVKVANGTCEAISPVKTIDRFKRPDIFLAKDTVLGQQIILPRWLWTNKVPQSRKKVTVLDMAADEKGRTFVLIARKKGNKQLLQVQIFSPEGLFRDTWTVEKVPAGTKAFIQYTPAGKILISDEERFLSLYNPDGSLLWSKERSMPGLSGVSVGPLGNIFVASRYEDTLFFGPKVCIPFARGSLLLAKYSPRGEIIWVETFPVDDIRGDEGNMVSTDCQGYVYLGGGFDVIANFREQILRANLNGENYFLSKFHPEGNLLWARRVVTQKTRNRTADFYTDCDGNSFLSLNRELFFLDALGNTRWSEELLQPNGGSAIKTRIQGAEGDVYVAGFTEKSDFFITTINRINKQAIIWKGAKAYTDPFYFPAICSDERGNIFVSGVSKGKNFPGAQFDLTSKSKVFLIKYGRPDGTFQREPILLCRGEKETLVTNKGQGLRYQWFRDGQAVQGGNSYYLQINRVGTYQVQVVSEFCDRISLPRQVSSCDGDPMKNTPITVVNQVENIPEAPKEEPEVEEDINYDPKGTPKKIRSRRVKSQEQITISSRDAKIYLWDHGAVDNDTVSVNINGQWLVESYRLEKQKQTIDYTFQPGNNYIILYALNLGGVPPNTASIMVDDGIKQQTLQLRSTLKQCGMLRVKVED